MIKTETYFKDGKEFIRIFIDPELKDYVEAAQILLGDPNVSASTSSNDEDDEADYDDN